MSLLDRLSKYVDDKTQHIIHDVRGKLVYQSFNPSSERISIAALASGLYAVSFFTDEGVGMRKLVIQN